VTAAATKFSLWDILDDAVITTDGGLVRVLELEGLDGIHTDYNLLGNFAADTYVWLKGDAPEEIFLQFGIMSAKATLPRDAYDAIQDPILRWQTSERLEFLEGRDLRRNRVVMAFGSLESLPKAYFPKITKTQHTERHKTLNELQLKLETLGSRLGLTLKTLSRDEVFELYSDWLGDAPKGDLKQNPLSNPVLALRAARDRFLPGHVRWTDEHVRVGGTYFSVLTLKDLDEQTYFGLADDVLMQLPDFARVSILGVIPNQDRTRAAVLQGRKFQSAQSGKGEFLKDEAELAKLAEATALYETLIQTGQRLVAATIQILVYASNEAELRDRERTIQNKLREHRLTFFDELRAHDRELGNTLPGLGARSNRTMLMTSNNFGDLMPVFSDTRGDVTPCFLFETARSYLFNFDPFERTRDSWNGMILGASGSGKSVFTNMLIAQSMATRPGRTMIVDFAGETKSSYLMIAKLFGGQFFPVLSDSNDYAINPFPTKAEAWDGDGIKATVSSFLVVLTDLLIANEGTSMESELFRVILTKAIEDTYRDLPDDAEPVYSNLLKTLQGYEGRADIDAGRLETILKLLGGFLEGPSAKFLNRQSTINVDAPFVIFDLFGIDALPANVREALVFLVTSFVKNLAFDASDSNRKYIYLDEVAQLIKRDSMKSLLDELYSTARKHNTSVWTITQQFAAYKKSAVAGVIALNSTTLVLLSHANDSRARDLVATDLSLNEREAELFGSLRTVKGQFSELLIKTQVADTRLGKKDIAAKCRLALSPADYEVCTSDAEDRALQKKFMAANPKTPLVDVLKFITTKKAENKKGRGAA